MILILSLRLCTNTCYGMVLNFRDKEVEAPFVKQTDIDNNLSELAGLSPQQQIGHLLWSENGYKPEVFFSIGYSNNAVLLRYTVTEKYPQAIYKQTNDPVYKDSCVEFFISFDDESNYYNLEFNQLGTVLGAYGTGRNNRIELDIARLECIISHNKTEVFRATKSEYFYWELALQIPFSVFQFHDIIDLKGRVCKGNFYKCGDDLPEPHFLSWTSVDHPSPNFHLPQFFGKVRFV